MRIKNALAATATLCVLTLLTGCGDGSQDAADEPTAVESTTAEPTTEEPTEEPTTEEPMEESTEPKESTPSKAPEEVVITIEEFVYSEIEPVAPGTEVTVENIDATAHTLTADGEGDFDVTIAPGESATFTAPDEAGEYPYLCTFHAGMTSTLVVE